MGVPTKRFAVFLCLIILHQDLVIARSHYDLEMIAPPRLTSAVDTADDDFPSNQTITSNALAISSARALGREKRLFGLILFTVSIVVTAVATTIETIYDIKGCCGLGFDYLCSFEADFRRRRDAIQARADAVDRRLYQAVKKKDNLECLSKVIEAFWTEIKRLVTLQDEFFDSISPGSLDSIIKKEKRILGMTRGLKWDNITPKRIRSIAKSLSVSKSIIEHRSCDRNEPWENTIRDVNSVLDENDLKEFEEKLEANQLALKLSLGWTSAALPGFALLGRQAWKAFKFNRLYKTLKATQLETLLKSTPRAKELVGFTGTSAKTFIKGIAKTRFAAKASLAAKGMKIVKFGGIFMSALSIVMDIFSTVSILVGCYNKKKEAENTMSKLDEPENNVIEMEGKIKEYEDEMKTEMEDKIVPELRKGELHSALTQVKKTIKDLPEGQRTWLTRDCVDTIIPDALETFKTSNNFVVLKDELKYVIENCVSPLKYAYECLISRSKVMTRILGSCRKGVGDFDKIYEQALEKEGTKKEQCIKDGEPYTPKEDYQKSLKDVSAEEGFPIPCRLNSEAFKSDICSRQNGGQTPEEIAEKVKMDLSEVKKVLEKCKEGEDSLNAAQIKAVCDMKSLCDPPSEIAEIFQDDFGKPISVDQVKSLPCSAKLKNPDCPTLYD